MLKFQGRAPLKPISWIQFNDINNLYIVRKVRGDVKKKSGAFLAESCGHALKIKIEKKCIYK